MESEYTGNPKWLPGPQSHQQAARIMYIAGGISIIPKQRVASQ